MADAHHFYFALLCFRLKQILERQQKLKPGEKEQQDLLLGELDVNAATEEAAIEMGMTRRRVA